jgi:tetratricopeptide (TPR) repeat protein
MRQQGVAALAMAAALAAPYPAAGGGLPEAETAAASIQERLAAVERLFTRPDESSFLRARRKFSSGETQFLLGDWLHASVLLAAAIEEPEFRATSEYPLAVVYLAEALRLQDACGSAAPWYAAVHGLGEGPWRGTGLAGELACRVRLRRHEGIDALLAEIGRAYPGGVPSEVAYLSGKALYHRRDLAPAERRSRALAAFQAVPPPYHLAAAYFLGVLELETGDLDRAAQRFERCTTLQADDPSQRQVKELCFLALGRIYAEQGRADEALDRYQAIPRTSENFDEALLEIAWGFVKAGRLEPALSTASLIVDLAPESQLAPEATILTGHLLLRLGRYGAATEAYNQVINRYAPVRDEIDAILTLHEDPVRYLDELIGRRGRAFDVRAVLPPIAVKWASAQRDVDQALELVRSMEGAGRDLEDGHALADRLDASLARGGGLDAAPVLKAGWAAAEAVQNALARVSGSVSDSLVGLAAGRLPPARRDELQEVHRQRVALQAQLDAMPRSADEVEARLERMRRRLDEVDRAVYRMGYEVDSVAASIAGTEVWLEQHRTDIASDEQGRAEFSDELRTHRSVTRGYEQDVRALRHEVDEARDAAGSVAAVEVEGRLRKGYLELVTRERALVAEARGEMGAGDLAELDRGEALLDRLAAIDVEALGIKELLAGEARRRADELRARVAAARAALDGSDQAMDQVRAESRGVVGAIAYRSFSSVRAQFYKLVLKADVGIVDVAWSRKRERLDRIQTLSQQKAAELEGLDRDYRLVLKEVD